MSTMTYAYLVGQKTGRIKGSIRVKGREDSIGVIAVSHAIVSPRDVQSGLPTGQRMHKPFVFTKELDKSTPVLFNSLCTNENLTSAEFHFFNGDVETFNVKLTNANVASIDLRQANIRDPALEKRAAYEEVALTYQKIEWTWIEGGISAMDDWSTKV